MWGLAVLRGSIPGASFFLVKIHNPLVIDWPWLYCWSETSVNDSATDVLKTYAITTPLFLRHPSSVSNKLMSWPESCLSFPILVTRYKSSFDNMIWSRFDLIRSAHKKNGAIIEPANNFAEWMNAPVVTLFGMTLYPRESPHAKTTCAGVAEYFLASSLTILSCKSVG